MARSARDNGLRYAFRFAGTTLFVLAVTLLLVLYVFPERYVLDSGFRESGQNLADPLSPFELDPVQQVVARPLPVPRPEPEESTPQPGPAEMLWSEVLPLIGQERYDAAASRLRTYLADYPRDRTARSELAVVLLRADRPDEAVVELRRLVEGSDGLEQRIQLARTLRELGRTDGAASEFRALVESRPEDPSLWLEWARTYTWAERYPEAADILTQALDRHPTSVPLRVESARTRFTMDDPQGAARVLAGIPDEALAEVDALGLREALIRATTVPEPEPPPPPTLFEQAVQAREDNEFARSGELFQQALEAESDDAEIWEALANLREYELADFDGAREALLEVERIREADTSSPPTALELRIARLESWLDMSDEARARLGDLLSSDGLARTDASAAHALLGDVARWEDDRPSAAEQYKLALAADSTNAQARDGVEALDAAVARVIRFEERPGGSALSYLGADTDDFVRMDVGGQWVRVRDDWVFGGTAGGRFVDGLGLFGEQADVRRGFFTDLEATRWWRHGTIRTTVELGLQDLAEDVDYSVALSVGHRGAAGSRVDLRYEHGPAYLTTTTLQSLIAGVVQDVVQVTVSRRLDDDWSLAALGGASWLETDLADLTDARNESTVRLQLDATLWRRLSETFALGLATEFLGFTDPGPVVTDALGTGRRLYWDPRLFISVQPFLRVERDFSGPWSFTGRVGAGAALIDDRPLDGLEAVPQLTAELGLRRESDRYGVSLDLFTAQGQFDGYRVYGMRFGITGFDALRDGVSR